MSPEEMFDPVNRPKHYVSENGLEAINVIEAFAKDNYHRGTALKYLLRAGNKDDLVQDLKKAVWYINREIKLLEEEAKRGIMWSEPPVYAFQGIDVCCEQPAMICFHPCDGCTSHACEGAQQCLHWDHQHLEE